METSKKHYHTPDIKVLEAPNESIICASVTNPFFGNEEEEW